MKEPLRTARLATLLSLLMTFMSGTAAAEAERAEESEELMKRHTVSLLSRIVTEERAEGGAGIGLEYEYRLHEKLGTSAFAEYVAGELQVGVFGVMVNYHPGERPLIGIGPGVEKTEGETRALIRVGGLYEFEADEITFAPAVYLDWLEGGHHALVMGFNFGKKF